MRNKPRNPCSSWTSTAFSRSSAFSPTARPPGHLAQRGRHRSTSFRPAPAEHLHRPGCTRSTWSGAAVGRRRPTSTSSVRSVCPMPCPSSTFSAQKAQRRRAIGSSTRSRRTPRERPLAWIDDAHDDSCRAWAAGATRADAARGHRAGGRAHRRARRRARALGRGGHAAGGPPSSMTTRLAGVDAEAPQREDARSWGARCVADRLVADVQQVGARLDHARTPCRPGWSRPSAGCWRSTAASAGAAAAIALGLAVDAARSTIPGEVIAPADELDAARLTGSVPARTPARSRVT